MEFNEILFACQPLANLWRLVIRHVVSDHVDLRAIVVSDQLPEKIDEGVSVEHLYEARMPFGIFPNPHRAHYLAALADRGAQHVCSDSDTSPRPMNGTGLLEHGFILIERYASILSGFFLIRGSSLSRQVI